MEKYKISKEDWDFYTNELIGGLLPPEEQLTIEERASMVEDFAQFFEIIEEEE